MIHQFLMAKAEIKTMNLNHIHLRVRDLNAAIGWFETVLKVHPGFQNEHMAAFSLGAFTLIFDAAEEDVVATVGFESEDCDRDFRTLVERGAVSIAAPTDKDWG